MTNVNPVRVDVILCTDRIAREEWCFGIAFLGSRFTLIKNVSVNTIIILIGRYSVAFVPGFLIDRPADQISILTIYL